MRSFQSLIERLESSSRRTYFGSACFGGCLGVVVRGVVNFTCILEEECGFFFWFDAVFGESVFFEPE